jgi:hypothetical protein
VLPELLQCNTNIGRPRVGVERRQLLSGQRPASREQRCFKQLRERTHERLPAERKE